MAGCTKCGRGGLLRATIIEGRMREFCPEHDPNQDKLTEIAKDVWEGLTFVPNKVMEVI